MLVRAMATYAAAQSRLALDQMCARSGTGAVGAVLCVASEQKLGQSQPLDGTVWLTGFAFGFAAGSVSEVLIII